SAAGLALSALTDTEYAATAKVASNSDTGDTKATTNASTLVIGSGGESQNAHDATVLAAISANAVLSPQTYLIVATSTTAINTVTRNTEATVTGSTVTVTGGDADLSATTDGHVLAWDQSISIKTKANNIPTSSA